MAVFSLAALVWSAGQYADQGTKTNGFVSGNLEFLKNNDQRTFRGDGTLHAGSAFQLQTELSIGGVGRRFSGSLPKLRESNEPDFRDLPLVEDRCARMSLPEGVMVQAITRQERAQLSADEAFAGSAESISLVYFVNSRSLS